MPRQIYDSLSNLSLMIYSFNSSSPIPIRHQEVKFFVVFFFRNLDLSSLTGVNIYIVING